MSELFDLFWSNTKLSASTAFDFKRRIDRLAGTPHRPETLQYAEADIPLSAPRGALDQHLRRRTSTRHFSKRALSIKQISQICSGLRARDDGMRLYPSAGATYPAEVFWLFTNTAAPLGGRLGHYNPDNHSISPFGSCPRWEAIEDLFGIDTGDTVPAAVAIFVVFPERVTAKYGDRGGRFALIEVGHMAQNLGLALACHGIAGVEAGGLMDDAARDLIGLRGTTAQIALGYLVGMEAKVR